MLTIGQLLNPQTLAQVLANPNALSLYVDTTALNLVVKSAVLIILLLYIFFAFTAWFQVKRLETWLMSLRKYNFRRYMFIHLILAGLGWVLALIIL
jgi:hypothetical protein